MPFSAVYLIQRFFYRFWLFVYHWYIGSFLLISRQMMTYLESLDRSLALKITLKNLFKPLYQDKTTLGYILGFIFRLFRVLVGVAIYLTFFAIGLAIYIFWASIPIYIIVKGFIYG